MKNQLKIVLIMMIVLIMNLKNLLIETNDLKTSKPKIWIAMGKLKKLFEM